MKKILALVLSALLILTGVFSVPVVANTNDDTISEAFPELSDKLWKVYKMESDGYIGIPVVMSVYATEKRTKDNAVILYVINHNMPRVGTEDDVSIITDLLEEGYVVAVADYLNSPLAVSPAVEHSIQNVRLSLSTDLNELGNIDVGTRSYVLPAGYRIARYIEYFDISKHAYVGALQHVVNQWNMQYFKDKCNSRIPGGWFEATDYTQLIGPSGDPICWQLHLDIIYPSEPETEVPVLMRASSSQYRNDNDTTVDRPYKVAAVMRGYAFVLYDHEYVPLCRNEDGYGYLHGSGSDGKFFNYGLADYIGVQAHTAAIRCVRYYAEDYGYSTEKIGVYGMSKSSFSALLTNEDPTSIPEKKKFNNSEVDSDNPDATYGEQPFLTYRDGTPISSRATVAYTGMGDGLARHRVIANENSNPFLLVCGVDEFGSWDDWASQLEYFNSLNIPVMEISMPDRTGISGSANAGHAFAVGIDPLYKYDRYAAAMDYLDYYLKETNPKHVYTYPANGSSYIDGEDIFFQFTAPMDAESIAENIKVYHVSTGEEISGTWSSMYGGTKWYFHPQSTMCGGYFDIVVYDTLTDVSGRTLQSGNVSRVMGGKQTIIDVSGDTYIDVTVSDNANGDKNTVLVNGTNNGYFTFESDDILNSTGGALKLKISADEAAPINVYAIEGKFDENAFNSDDSLLESAQLVSNFEVDAGTDVYNIDVSEFIKNTGSNAVTFIILSGCSVGIPDGIKEDFDSYSASTFSTDYPIAGNQEYYNVHDTYKYAGGGASGSFTLSDKNCGEGNGHSLKIANSINSYDGRYKILNSFGDAELTADDIGNAYIVEFDIFKEQADGYNLETSVGITSSRYVTDYSQSFVPGTSGKYKISGYGKWEHIKHTIVINEEMVQKKAALITINNKGVTYIDNISVTPVNTDFIITSKEGAQNGYESPALLVDYVLNKEFIASADTSFGDDETVHGSETVAVINSGSDAYVTFNSVYLKQTETGSITFELYSESDTTVAAHLYKGAISESDTDNQNLDDEAYILGTINVKSGYNTYTLDISDCLKDNIDESVTLVLSSCTIGLQDDFNSRTSYVRYSGKYIDNVALQYDACGGWNNSVSSLSSDQNHGEGEGMSIFSAQGNNLATGNQRLRLFNTFGSIVPGEEDIGKVYHATVWVYKDSSQTSNNKISVGLMSIGNWDTSNGSTDPRPSGSSESLSSDNKWEFTLNMDTWNKIEVDLTITEQVLERKAFWFTFVCSGAFYFDDISIYCSSDPDVQLVTKEGAAANSERVAPTLSLTNCGKLDETVLNAQLVDISVNENVLDLNLVATEQFKNSVDDIQVFIDNVAIFTRPVRTGKDYNITVDKLAEGDHKVKVVVTYQNGQTVTTKEETFTVDAINEVALSSGKFNVVENAVKGEAYKVTFLYKATSNGKISFGSDNKFSAKVSDVWTKATVLVSAENDGAINGTVASGITIANVSVEKLTSSTGGNLINIGNKNGNEYSILNGTGVEQSGGTQAMRFYFGYETTTGSNIIIGGENYQVVARGFKLSAGKGTLVSETSAFNRNPRYVSVLNSVWQAKDLNADHNGKSVSNAVFSTYITNLLAEDDREITAIAYLKIKVGDNVYTVYSDSVTGSVAQYQAENPDWANQ